MEQEHGTWGGESQKQIDHYLDQIERILFERNLPRSERSMVLGEIESQIYAIVQSRRETGVDISEELVRSVLETLDSPEAYRAHQSETAMGFTSESTNLPPVSLPSAPLLSVDGVTAESAQAVGDETVHTASGSIDSSTTTSSDMDSSAVPPRRVGYRATLKNLWNQSGAPSYFARGKERIRRYRSNPRWDEVAIASAVCLSLCTVLLIANPRDAFPLIVLSALLSCGLGWLSLYRIRQSRGLLRGQRIAWIGAMALPVLLINVVAIYTLIATPIAYGILALAVVYANYRLLRMLASRLAPEGAVSAPLSGNSAERSSDLSSNAGAANPTPA